MIKAILFDMDGVLIDSHDAWFYIFNKALSHFENKTISVEKFDKFLWAKAFDKVAKDYFTAPLEEIRAYYRQIYKDYKERVKLMENAEEALSSLKEKGIKLVVVSNTQRNVVKKVLDDVGISRYFELFLGGDDVERGKPEPDILLKALELLRLKKGEILFVGDTRWDKIAAGKAGVRFVGFRTAGDERVDDLGGLLDLI